MVLFAVLSRRSKERGRSHGDAQGDRAATSNGRRCQGAVTGSGTAQSRGRTTAHAHVRCPRPERALAASDFTATEACLGFHARTIHTFLIFTFSVILNYKLVALLLLLLLEYQNLPKQRCSQRCCKVSMQYVY